MNHEGTTVFSKQGLITVGKGRGIPSDYISHDNLVRDGMNKQIYSNLPIFRKFQILKTFKQWKYAAQYKKYQRTREFLTRSLIPSKPQFAEGYVLINQAINEIKDLRFLDIKKSAIFARKQQSLTEKTEKLDILKSQGDLSKILYRVKIILKQLKDTILRDDTLLDEERRKWQELAILKKGKHEEHIVFTKARKRRELEGEKMKVSKTRHKMFDNLIAYVNRFVASNLAQVLFENKKDFTEVILDPAISPQFELSVCFDHTGKVNVTPTFEEHFASFTRLFNSVDRSITKNPTINEFYEFINELYFLRNMNRKGQTVYFDWKEHISRISKENLEVEYHRLPLDFEKWKSEEEKQFINSKRNDSEEAPPRDFITRILARVKYDISESREFVANFNETQEIHDFSEEWKRKINSISPEMNFYKETWEKIKVHEKIISRIPNFSNRRGTILIETLGFKNYLNELPKMVIDSIRYNVASTMEKDTRALKDDLYKVVETLEQTPSSINIYLEQINMCKYISFKMPEFTQKFQSIDNLNELCRQDNIKITTALQEDIERVKELYEKLPTKLAEAEEALKAKQVSIETIIHTSSDTLSKKIRAFQKKYIETYLQDKSRIDECHQTLEELFKRSKAIQEIKSKVILYKEFFNRKVELESSKNFDKLHELHIQTINLWKMILYWRKRREM